MLRNPTHSATKVDTGEDIQQISGSGQFKIRFSLFQDHQEIHKGWHGATIKHDQLSEMCVDEDKG